MGTKTIRVREEIYEQLRAQKRSDESFSDLLARLADRDTQFEEGFGAFADVAFDRAVNELDDRFAKSR